MIAVANGKGESVSAALASLDDQAKMLVKKNGLDARFPNNTPEERNSIVRLELLAYALRVADEANTIPVLKMLCDSILKTFPLEFRGG